MFMLYSTLKISLSINLANNVNIEDEFHQFVQNFQQKIML